MDWVHCNNCFLLPGCDKRFFLTSCGHIFCADCIDQCTDGLCKLCGNQCTSIPLSSQMKPEVEMYFIDPMETLKKEILKVQQIVEFQNNHRSRLMAHNNKQIEKMKLMKEDLKKMVKRYKELESEKKRYREETNYLKNLIGVSPQTTPELLRNISRSNCSSANRERGSYKGNLTTPSPYDNASPSPSTLRDRMFPKPHNVSSSGRITVRTPPINGRMGVIPGVTSPADLENIHLAARSSRNALSPMYSQSQESVNSEYYPAREGTPSPLSQGYTTPRNCPDGRSAMYRYNDKKRHVVYPFKEK